MQIETLAVHAGHATEASGAVAPSIVPSTTFAREPDGSQPSGYNYARVDNPNRHALEACLRQLESGAAAVAFASGVAACAGVLSALRPGDHLLAPLDVYHGNRLLITHEFTAWGMAVDFVDFTDLEAVRAALRPETRLVWAETPSNPLLQVEDIAALAVIAHAGNAHLAVDNTFATPVLQNPLALGADFAVHSSSKYFGGHSDVVGGAVVAAQQDEFTDRIRSHQITSGSIPSPFDCWLLLRSIATLPMRIRAQSAAAARVAEFLAGHAGVSKVNYPGLPSHPDHAIAAQQMHQGFGAMLSFHLAAGREAALRTVARVELFTRATSLGGVESLIEHRASSEGPESPTPQDLIRASIGIEHVDDLIDDLRQALA